MAETDANNKNAPRAFRHIFSLLIGFAPTNGTIQIRIYFPQYQKEGVDKILPSCCIDIDSEVGHFLDNKALEMTIKEIQSYVSDFGLSIDIELGSDDQFVTADEFINQYNVEEIDVISILIY